MHGRSSTRLGESVTTLEFIRSDRRPPSMLFRPCLMRAFCFWPQQRAGNFSRRPLRPSSNTKKDSATIFLVRKLRDAAATEESRALVDLGRDTVRKNSRDLGDGCREKETMLSNPGHGPSASSWSLEWLIQRHRGPLPQSAGSIAVMEWFGTTLANRDRQCISWYARVQ